MPITMKADKDFRGNPGEGNVRGDDRNVENGLEFTVATQPRADYLEEQGFAHPIAAQKAEQPHKNKMEPQPENKAADAGPLPLAGGETGEGKPPSSSPAAPARVKRKYTKRGTAQR